ncbi:MAG: transketolase [bacterium]|nr:transketolase [bacterium]MCP5043041.1 transketolase [bacterium]
MRKTCLEMVHELARGDERIVFIGSDLGHGTLAEFERELPDRFYMEGISEMNVVGMAAGLAMEGRVPYVNTIATFLTRRCYEQVAMDVCHANLPVRLIGNGGGLVYAPLGPTHEATEDIAIMRALPNMTIVAPADAEEMRQFMRVSVDHQGPIYIRLAKGYDPVVTNPRAPFEIGKAVSMREGNAALLVTTGISLRICLEAVELLAASGIDAGILHMPTVKPLDTETLADRIARVPAVVSVEEHSIIGGLGSATAELIAEAGFATPKQFRRVAIPDAFPSRYGSQASQLDQFDITAKHVAQTVKRLIARNDNRRAPASPLGKGDGKWQSRKTSRHLYTKGPSGTVWRE